MITNGALNRIIIASLTCGLCVNAQEKIKIRLKRICFNNKLQLHFHLTFRHF